jgi:hypothetical protein
LFHSSWRISSNFFGDVESNLFLTLVSKTDQSGSDVCVQIWSLYWPGEDVEVHLHVLRTSIEEFQLCEWGHYRLGKLHHCSEITSGSWDAPDYPTCHSSSLSIVLARLNGLRSRPPTSQKIWEGRESNPGPLDL